MLQSAPAQILSGGNIVGNSQRITNDKSNIIAGGTLALKDKVTNIDDENGLHRLTFSGTSQYSKSRWRGGRRRYFQRDWYDVIDYERVIETPFNMGIYRMDENTQSSQQYQPDDISTYKTDTQSKTDYQLNGSHFAQAHTYELGDLADVKGVSHSLESGSLFNVAKNSLNSFSAENIKAEKANALLSDVAATRAGIDSNLNPTTPKTGSINVRRLEHFSLNAQQEVRTITPNLQLPNNRIYRVNCTTPK